MTRIDKSRLTVNKAGDGEFKPYELFNEQVRAAHTKTTFQAFEYLSEVSDGLFEEVLPLMVESSELMLSAAKETNRSVGPSYFAKLGKGLPEEHQDTFKSKLNLYMKKNYVEPMNSGIDPEIPKQFIKGCADNNIIPKEGMFEYAMFEKKLQEFIYTSFLGKMFPGLIQRTINSYSPEYFNTFDNTVDQKMEALKKLSVKMSIIIAPKLYKHVSPLYAAKDETVLESFAGSSLNLYKRK